MRAGRSFGAACAALAWLLGCSAPDSASAPPPASVKPEETSGQWLLEDGAGEVRLTFRLQAQTIDFIVICRQADKSLAVSAADPSPKGAPPPAAGDAIGVLFGAASFSAKLETEGTLAAPGRVTARLTAGPDTLRALKEAGGVRLVYRDAFTETDLDQTGAIGAFADRCAALTGIAPEP